jgi:alanine-glyoxylate transaminase/serine-glyoxylate transaminase/serine-pyruvate transaminase
MPSASGRQYLAIPGPSVMPDRVLRAMHRAAPNIYGGELHDIVASLFPDLRRLAGTRHHVAIYIGNGHAAWEAASANIFTKGDRALVVATGHFGIGWADSVRGMGVDVDVLDFGKRAPIDMNRLADTLRADRGHALGAVLVTHVDTATTLRADVAAVRAALDAVGHPALLIVDCIASLGCDPFLMDDWGVDVMLAASQKGLMTPPGMCFVWFNDKARAAGAKAGLRTPYWDWGPRVFGEMFYQHFCGTAPTHHIYGLREALDMIFEEGLPQVWARHAVLAGAVWAAVDAWGRGGPMELNVADPAHRGHSVTGVRIGAPHGTALRAWCEDQGGVTLGIGLGMAEPGDPAWHGFFRVAHMGHVNAHMTLGALATMDAGLKALGIPHGAGALDAAASALARAPHGAPYGAHAAAQ